MLIILDYDIGNLNSIKNMLKKGGYRDVLISSKKEDIENATKLILPGVGHFDYGMSKLRNADFFNILNHQVLEKKVPILGICLGVQLLTEGSEEGNIAGLGWIKGRTIRFQEEKMNSNLKIPHMGWSNITIEKPSPLFENMYEEPRFYFVHTYHLQCDNKQDILTTSEYGYKFTGGVERKNILGVQFHPEKSHKFGMRLLQNFVNNY